MLIILQNFSYLIISIKQKDKTAIIISSNIRSYEGKATEHCELGESAILKIN